MTIRVKELAIYEHCAGVRYVPDHAPYQMKMELVLDELDAREKVRRRRRRRRIARRSDVKVPSRSSRQSLVSEPPLDLARLPSSSSPDVIRVGPPFPEGFFESFLRLF